MNASRGYTMVARADAVADTRRRILEAGFALTQEKLTVLVSLADIAERADVTVRTILRHFGNREGLLDAVAEYTREQLSEEREAPPGDLPAAARAIVDHYERRGDFVLQMLAQEQIEPRIAVQLAGGRRIHREWVRTVFAPQLARAVEPAVTEDLLVVATDIYTWKLLRRDARHSRQQTEDQILTLIRLVAGEGA